MTIEERLERLTERHEALTQNVESLAENGKATDKRIEALGKLTEDLLKASAQDAENIRALARIAALRERRLTDLEGGSGPAL
jgi:hypothetical protein